jgi:hypothetical protein
VGSLERDFNRFDLKIWTAWSILRIGWGAAAENSGGEDSMAPAPVWRRAWKGYRRVIAEEVSEMSLQKSPHSPYLNGASRAEPPPA